MKRPLIGATIFLLFGVQYSPAGETLRIPTRGEWQGQAIGSWTLTRTTRRSAGESTVDGGRLYKALLLGEDGNNNTIQVWGEADEQGRYLVEKPTLVSTSWSEENPIPNPTEIRNEVLTIDGQAYPVFVNIYDPTPDPYSGIMVSKTVWELKSKPGFVLMRNHAERDSFRGENYESLITEQVVGTGQTNINEKVVRYFEIQQIETVDGKVTSRIKLLKSDALPHQGLIHSLQTYYNEEGRAKQSTRIDLVAVGCSPEEAERYEQQRQSRSIESLSISLDSAAGEINTAHLMRQGMPEAVAREIVGRLPVKDFTRIRQRADEISVAWKAYQADPSDDNRAVLLQQQQLTGSNSYGYIEPGLEKVLLEISHTDNPELRIQALTSLTGFVSVRYAPILEDALIQLNQSTNQTALNALASSKWGNPRRVLSQNGIDLSALPMRLIPYAPDTLAAKELMHRFEIGDKYERSKVLELLTFYSTPETRALFTRLANDLCPSDFKWGKTDRSFLVTHLITGVANLNIENAPDLFSQWMDWNHASTGEEDSPESMTTRELINMTLMISGVRLRDSRLNARIADLISTGAISSGLFMSGDRLDNLAGLKLELTPTDMEALLTKPAYDVWTGTSSAGKQIYDRVRLFRFSPRRENLMYMMHKLMPDWTPETDYADMAMARSKYWYRQRKEVQPLDVPQLQLEILADTLPFFGDEGARILIQLCGEPQFRRYMVPALVNITHRRDGAREYLSGIHEQLEEDRFRLNLTLWCMGDTSKQGEIENYIRFEPLYSSRSMQAREVLRYLPFETVYPLLQDIRSSHPDNDFALWAAEALSHHPNRKSAEFIMALWEREITGSHNAAYGEMFNRMAGRNFGMDREGINKWIQSLPAK